MHFYLRKHCDFLVLVWFGFCFLGGWERGVWLVWFGFLVCFSFPDSRNSNLISACLAEQILLH